MSKVIVECDAIFTGINEPIPMLIPEGSEEVAIRVYEDEQKVSVFVLQDFSILPQPANYTRTFQLILVGEPVPATYKKYVATIPFGPENIQTHIVEV